VKKVWCKGNEKEIDRDVFGEEKYTLKSENDTICWTKFECYNDTLCGMERVFRKSYRKYILPIDNFFNCVQ
jgi:hypothetical protein